MCSTVIAFSAFCIVMLTALAVPAQAQFVNGDFEMGSTGWIADTPDRWTIEFPAVEGNPDGYCRMMSPFGDSGGEACIEQSFECKSPGGCPIFIDYRHRWIDSSPLQGRIHVYLGGGRIHTSAPVNEQQWTTVQIGPVTQGSHDIRICLEVDEGNNGWEAGIDNVACPSCQGVAVESTSWGVIKSSF